MVGEILTGLEFLLMGLWIFVVLFVSYRVNKRSNQSQKTPYKSQQTEYEYPQFPEKQAELNISEEERKLKEWLNDVFGTNIEVDRPESVVYEEQPSYEEVEEDSYDDYEEEYVSEDDVVDTEYTVTAPQVTASYGERTVPVFYGLNRAQIAQGIIMAEVLGKPRALNPMRPRYHNRNNISA